jgi:hypothetical protein
MKRFFWFIAVCFLGIVSCVSGPEPLPQEPAPVVQPAPVAPVPVTPAPVVVAPVVPEPVAPPPPEPESPPVEEVFDSTSLSDADISRIEAEVRQFIANLTQIIRRKDYKGWNSNLDTDYFSEISSPAFLERISNEPRLKSQKKVLTSAEDYFTNVIVPSRANDRVDDVSVISETRAKAYTTTGSSTYLLYNLAKMEGSWMIVDPSKP